MDGALLIINLLVSVAGLSALLVKVGRVLQRQDEHERRLNEHERHLASLRGRP